MSQTLNFKFVVVGNSAVGKTRLLVRYVQNTFTTAFYNTVGIDFKMKQINIDGKKIRLQIWDTAGQQRYRTITSSIYKRAQGVMLVYDVTDRGSFEALRGWRDEAERNLDKDAVMMVIGNKTDKKEDRVVSEQQGKQYAKSQGFLFMETSAAEDYCVKEAFEMLAKKTYDKMKEEEKNEEKQMKKGGEKEKEIIKLEEKELSNDTDALGERKTVSRKGLTLTHEETKQKKYEIELSWIAKENGYVHELVPRQLSREAEEQALKEIENDQMA